MKHMRHYAPLLLLLMALTPMAGAFTWDGTFNYATPGGGIVRYALDFTSQTWLNAATQQRWGTTVYGGAAIGLVGFDPSTGVVMTVTGMALLQLNYTVVSIGAHTQRIYYRGLGAPDTTTGGTSATAGTIITVTTNGNTNVVLTWGGAAPGPGAGASASSAMFGASSVLIMLLPLLIVLLVLEDIRTGALGASTVWRALILSVIIGAGAWLVSGWGY